MGNCLKPLEKEPQGGAPESKSATLDVTSAGNGCEDGRTLFRDRIACSHSNFHRHYKKRKELGRGSEGITYMCQRLDGGQEFAVKIVRKTHSTLNLIGTELKVLNTLRGCPHVAQLEEVFEDENCIYLVQELCTGGELFDHIQNKKGKEYCEADAAVILKDILQMTAECHLRGVIHRDIKAENFLFSDRGPGAQIKGVDFGFSQMFDEGQEFSERIGSANYVAPEVLWGKYGPPADLWSCGVIMYMLLNGHPPFEGKDEKETLSMVMVSKLDFCAGNLHKISPAAKDLLRKLLIRDPQARLTASQALSHPWLQKGAAPEVPIDFSVVAQMKRFSAKTRAEQVLVGRVARRFSMEDIADIKDQFMHVDIDRDGSVTLQELEQMIENAFVDLDAAMAATTHSAFFLLRRKPTLGNYHAVDKIRSASDGGMYRKSNYLVDAFLGADADCDGKVDYMEFVAATINLRQRSFQNPSKVKRKVREAFDAIDTNEDGYIDAEELEVAVGEGGRGVIEEADKNGDGLMSFREFYDAIRK